MSCLTLRHAETDVAPDCSVQIGVGRMVQTGRTDTRLVEVTFDLCYYARVGPHNDTEGVEAIGYEIDLSFKYEPHTYLELLRETWHATGVFPDPGFFVARQSDWLDSLPSRIRENRRHYVLDGRDGYAEVIADKFTWKEWIWNRGESIEQLMHRAPDERGEGTE